MNPRLADIPPSLIRELNSRKQPGDIDLGLGEPLLRPPGDLLVEAARWLADNGCKYGPNAGGSELRAAIAGRLGYPGLDRPENVCVTCGSQEAIYLAIKTLCDPALHEVLVCEPAYPLYRKIAQMEGVASAAAEMPSEDGFALCARRILERVTTRTRLIVLCSPCNPTGRIAPLAELQALAAGLSDLADPPYVLVDEAYRELWLGEAPPAALAAHYPRTLIAGSLSKSHALTGLRLGWFLAPAEILALAVKVHQFVLTSASALSQRVALALFSEGGPPSHRLHYVSQWAAYRTALERHGLVHQVPDGGFYAMVRLPSHLAHDSLQAALDLQARAGVVTIPGVAFGSSSEGWLRTSFVAPADQLDQGAARMARFFAQRRALA